MIPAEAVEAALAANRAYKSQRSMDNAEKQMRAVLEAAAPYMQAHLLAFADERDKALGAIRCHITTYELRKLLGATDD